MEEHIRPAHIRQVDNKVQSVKEHILGTRSFCVPNGGKIEMFYFASLVAKLHDMGKSTSKFENYINYSFNHPDDRTLRGKIDHSAIGAIYIYERYLEGSTLERLTSQMMALIVASHHGGLMNCIDLEGGSDLLDRLAKSKDELSYQEALDNFQKECYSLEELDEDFLHATEEVNQVITKIKKWKLPLNFSLHLVCKFLLSCLIDADRMDTMLFMENMSKQPDPMDPVLWKNLGIILEKNLAKMENDSEVGKLRSQISEACVQFASKEGGIYALNVPTGGGKTFSSLRFAIHHCLEHKKERIIYVVPYTTIIDQNAKKVRDILECGDLLLEHHSNVIVDDEEEKYKLLTQRWDSPIIFTTMVQFLNTIYAGGTQDIRRFHNLANAVLIFDEIQAVPVRCIHLLNSALNFLHYMCNSTVITCTATQPLLNKVGRPLFIKEKNNIIPNAMNYLKLFKRVELVNKTKPEGWTTNEIVDFIYNQLNQLDSVLLVVNTKKVAKTIFSALKDHIANDCGKNKTNLFHLSTNMCPRHRLNKIEAINNLLGKEKVICVSTQLIEAGVDISFDCVIRSMAGMESICQAAGRCNRNMEVECRDVFIINIKEETLTHLKEIKNGQDCSWRVLNEFNRDPNFFENDLLSYQAIELYYKYYYFDRKNEMDYPIEKKTSIYDFLGMNQYGDSTYKNIHGKDSALLIKQAYKDAGGLFHVIDEHTFPVLVPYGGGKQIINSLQKDCSFTERSKLLKQAQGFTVNLYERDLKKLIEDQAVYELKEGGVIGLNETFYNEDFGVDFENTQMDFCCV